MIWLRRMRGALGMGMVWAFAWAMGGLLIGLLSNVTPFLPWHLFFDVFDAPLPAMAMPGFFFGATFSMVLSIAGRGRKFTELSLLRFTAWGALGGLLLSLPFMLIVEPHGSTAAYSPMILRILIGAPMTLFSAVSAFGSLMLARLGERRNDFAAHHEAAG